MSDTKPSGLAKKLAAVMAEIGRVEKRGHNEAQNYKYARADDVAEAARAALAKHGVAVYPDVLENGVREISSTYSGNTKVNRISTCRVAWTFQDADTGEERTIHTPGEGMDSGDKGVYKAMTGAMKYMLMLGFLIPTGDGDPEVANEHDKEERAAKQRPLRGTPENKVTEQLRASIAAKVGPGGAAPQTSRDRKADLKRRFELLGEEDLKKAAAFIGEWIGRPFQKDTELTQEDWAACNEKLSAMETLGRAQHNEANGAVN